MEGCLHYNGGYLILFLFHLTIGAAFLSTSILYLFHLQKIFTSLFDPNCDTTATATIKISDSTVVNCDIFEIWRSIGIVGTVYGVACLLSACGTFFIILKRFFAANVILNEIGGYGTYSIMENSVAQRPVAPLTKGSLHKATGCDVLAGGFKLVFQPRQTQLEDEEEQDWTCIDFVAIWTKFFLTALLWLTSLVLPVYVSWMIITSEGLRSNDDQLFSISLAILCVAVTNLAIVVVSPFFILVEGNLELDPEEVDQLTRMRDLIVSGDKTGLLPGTTMVPRRRKRRRGWSIFAPTDSTMEEQDPLNSLRASIY